VVDGIDCRRAIKGLKNFVPNRRNNPFIWYMSDCGNYLEKFKCKICIFDFGYFCDNAEKFVNWSAKSFSFRCRVNAREVEALVLQLSQAGRTIAQLKGTLLVGIIINNFSYDIRITK